MQAIQSAILLDKQQMQFLFPEAKIIFEVYFGFQSRLWRYVKDL